MTDFDPARWRRMQPILDRVLGVAPGERRAWLKEACAGDERLRADVVAVLAADEEAGGVLDAPTGRFIEWFVEEARQQSTLTTPRQPAAPLDAGLIARQVIARHSRAGAAGRSPSSSPSPGATGRFLPGAMLASRYRVVALLGRGGMGEVYRADDLKLGQGVALKFLPASVENDPAHLERLLNEVRLARQVAHPSVCRVYDVGETEGRHFISMEYVDGEDLSSLLKRIGRLPNEKALHIAQQLCAGLAAAHEQGILHRDLKPANVMLDGRGRVRIADFGLAAGGVVEGRTAREGTKAYMAPEQLAGLEATRRSDLYALGLVLYEVFTGKRAFQADSEQELRRLQEESSPARPSSLVEGIGAEVERAILHCLEKDPALRPASALAVAASMPGGDPLAAALAAGETPSPEMVAAAGAEGALRPRTAWLLFAAAAGGLAAMIGLSQSAMLLNLLPSGKSPDALLDRAQEIVRALGYTDPPADSGSWMEVKAGYWPHLEPQAPSQKRFAGLASADPSPLHFGYRQSPAVLATGYGGGRISERNPAPFYSGEITVVLDSLGRLLQLSVVPPEMVEDSTSVTPPPDWSILLRYAQLAPGALTPAESDWLPDVPFDVHEAWKATIGGESYRVYAASFRGRPVHFRLAAPWDRPARIMNSSPSPRRWFQDQLWPVSFTVFFLVFGLVARHNLRLGRTDIRGALRIALLMFGFRFLGLLLGEHHVAEPRAEWQWFAGAFGIAALFAAFSGLGYAAFEPYVRRKWPHVLISWSRLLAGRWRDPLIGRDLLVGVLSGMAWDLAELAPEAVAAKAHVAGATPFVFLRSFTPSAGSFLGEAVRFSLPWVVSESLGFLGALFFLSAALRSRAAAVVLLTILSIATHVSGEYVYVGVLREVLALALQLACLLRFGLLSFCVAGGTSSILLLSPLTLDPSRWYAERSLFIIVVVLALTLWGVRTSLGRGSIQALGARRDLV